MWPGLDAATSSYRWLFVAGGNDIQVYSYASQELVCTLRHHAAKVTGIAVSPFHKMQASQECSFSVDYNVKRSGSSYFVLAPNYMCMFWQLFTSSMDGHVAVWDYSDGRLLRVSYHHTSYLAGGRFHILPTQYIDFGAPLHRFALSPGKIEPLVFCLVTKSRFERHCLCNAIFKRSMHTHAHHSPLLHPRHTYS